MTFVYEAAEISDKIRKPVKMFSTREDDMMTGVYRPAIKYRIAASVKNGEVTGYHLKEAAVNGNMYGLIPNFFPAGAIENYQVDVANYDSNITTGAWRAPYTNFLSYAEQSFLDELAEVMDKDPVQMRLDLLEKVKGTSDDRIQYSAERLQDVLKLAVEKIRIPNSQKMACIKVFVLIIAIIHMLRKLQMLLWKEINQSLKRLPLPLIAE